MRLSAAGRILVDTGGHPVADQRDLDVWVHAASQGQRPTAKWLEFAGSRAPATTGQGLLLNLSHLSQLASGSDPMAQDRGVLQLLVTDPGRLVSSAIERSSLSINNARPGSSATTVCSMRDTRYGV